MESVFEELASYVSNPEDSEEDEVQVATKSTRVLKEWLFEKKLDHDNEVEAFLQSEPHWAQCQDRPTRAGSKVEYRCNLVKQRGPQCKAALTLQYNSGDRSVTIFRTACDHTHDEILRDQEKVGIDEKVKALLNSFILSGVVLPAQLIRNLEEAKKSDASIKIPSKKQIYNFKSNDHKKGT